MKIGILAVQGAFIEHEKILNKLNIDFIEIRKRQDFIDNNIDGLILPGGESTVQGKLLKELNMFNDIQTAIKDGLPVLATCAGLILLAQRLENDDTLHLGTLPVTVRRNAYGRQLGSFETKATVGKIKDFPLVFIRAPFITEIQPEVTPLVEVDGNIVGVKYRNQIGLAFHPEMTNDYRIHEEFIKLVII